MVGFQDHFLWLRLLARSLPSLRESPLLRYLLYFRGMKKSVSCFFLFFPFWFFSGYFFYGDGIPIMIYCRIPIILKQGEEFWDILKALNIFFLLLGLFAFWFS